jgi:hypothetical protein
LLGCLLNILILLAAVNQILLYCLNRIIKIFNNVINVLCANRQTDGALEDTLICQLTVGQLRMSGGGRMNYQTLNICDVSQKREDLK